MTSLERLCRERRSRGEKPLVPFVTAGFPDTDTTLELLSGFAARGCDVVEVGVPFSDPVADGPLIQRASQAALDGGMSLRRALDLVAELRDEPVRPVLMGYVNPILRMGLAEFAQRAASAGCAGVIVPDLSREETGPLRETLAGEGVALVDLVAPTTPGDRLEHIARGASGFLYLVAVAGVTGTRSPARAEIAALAARTREHTDLPLYAGFGISDPQKARDALEAADGVIVGSALIERLLADPGPGGVTSALALVDDMLAAVSRRTVS